jgi:hypothetical protein
VLVALGFSINKKAANNKPTHTVTNESNPLKEPQAIELEAFI